MHVKYVRINGIMVLSDREIKKYLREGKIKITPKIDLANQLGSVSVDLRLGYKFRIFEHSRYPYIDPYDKRFSADVTKEFIAEKGKPFILQPGDFVLATTIESIVLPTDIVARLEGRSSLGRLGIVVHSTASVFEPGFSGKAVMELGNMGRIAVALYPGMKICALTFDTLSSPAEVPYNKKKSAKYMHQENPEPSKIAEEIR
jgi:dCTP deaminase